jgi:Arc/MetJ family transcription regulator
MRTNVVLDETLVEEAKALTGLKTTRAVIDEALRVLIQLRRQAEVADLFGQLRWEGDLNAMREGRSFYDADLEDSAREEVAPRMAAPNGDAENGSAESGGRSRAGLMLLVDSSDRPAPLELLQRPARRRRVLRRLRRAAHLPALPEDGRRERARAGQAQRHPG